MSSADISPEGAAHSLGLRGLPPPGERLHRLAVHLGERLRTHYATPPEVVWLALEPVHWIDGLAEEDQRALMLLVLAALLAQRAGSTRLPVLEAEGQAYLTDLLDVLLADYAEAPDVPATVAAMERLLTSGVASAILGDAGAFRPLVLERPHLYLQRMFALESRFAARFRRSLLRPDIEGRKEQFARVRPDLEAHPAMARGGPILLDAGQWAAVERAVCSPVCVISGGPGTGKTTIIVAILRALGRMGIGPDRIALAAPTGKAANRMAQAIRGGLSGCDDGSPHDRELAERPPECQTLHRLLGYSPGTDRFKHHENNRLSHAVVIVDEGSMVDLFMMERTLRSLDDDAQFVVLGDAEQLPSVEAGAVLRDLVPAAGADSGPLGERACRLTHSHRQKQGPDGVAILEVARAVNAGAVDRLVPPAGDGAHLAIREQVGQIRFQGVELHPASDRRGLDELLRHWYDRVVHGDDAVRDAMRRTYRHQPDGFLAEDRPALELLFSHLERSRILCLTHAQRTGAQRVNALFHERARDRQRAEHAFVAGEPVMMLRNDHDRQVFNGDQGVVLFVEEPGGSPRPMAVFPRVDGHGVFHLDALKGALTHAYAITVHKSQGSEFDRVLVILPQRDIPLNTRELLYTAITRARSGVLIHGAWPVFEAGATKRIRRFSGVAERLAVAEEE